MQNYQSDSLSNLIPSLIKAQMKLEIAEKSKKAGSGAAGSRSYKYADWPTIVEASRKALADNNLCVSQRLIEDNLGATLLSTLLLHATGEYIDSRIRLPINATTPPQSVGSCITYFKRYAYAALIGVVADDEDDDGAAAQKSHREYQSEPKNQTPTGNVKKTTLSDRELAVMEYELKDAPEIQDLLLERYGISSIRDMPVGYYEATLKRVREIKASK